MILFCLMVLVLTIGGVAAVDAEDGAVSPGGVGYDINCGVRVVTTRLEEEVVRARLHAVTHQTGLPGDATDDEAE